MNFTDGCPGITAKALGIYNTLMLFYSICSVSPTRTTTTEDILLECLQHTA